MEPTPVSVVKRAPSPELRAVAFEDVPEILRVIRRAIACGCREHYGPAQRAAVFAGYASVLFVEALGPFETIAAVLDGRIVGFAQLDVADERLRALFVDGKTQGHGIGKALLAEVEARAVARGCEWLHGAMALNAVPFYAHAGFRAFGDPERLTTAGIPVPIVRMEKRLRA